MQQNAPHTATRPADDIPDDRLAIRLGNLQHHFGEGELKKQVLFDNNLAVAAGEIVIVTGPSGSGKTTLLTLIGTLRTVQEGSIEVLGHQLLGASTAQQVRLRHELGFIFQAHNLLESLTAFQNVRMALELFPVGREQARETITALLTALGLAHRIHYKPNSLSGGQKQRVAIARGLVHKPKLILADEPTAALDEKSARDVVNLFQRYTKEEGSTILMVTHDNRLLDVADRIVNMVDGRIKSNVLVGLSTEICAFLKEVPVFARLTPRTLTEVADKMGLEKHPAGAVVVRQHAPGDKFYLIKQGTVDVLVGNGPEPRSVAKLSKGDFFGEAALLTGEPRNATIVALEDLELYTLGVEDFQAVLSVSATFEEELRKALFERH